MPKSYLSSLLPMILLLAAFQPLEVSSIGDDIDDFSDESGSYFLNQTGLNGTVRDPSLTISDGNYIYSTSYGLFTFSGTTPISYSLTPDQIGATILYSAIWLNASRTLNATVPDGDPNFPDIGDSTIVTAENNFFSTSTKVCSKATCTSMQTVARLDMSWTFYSGWQAPKLSITLTKTSNDRWGARGFLDFHLLWIQSVTDYTNWVVEGQCTAGQISVVTPLVPITELSEVVVVKEDIAAKIVDDPIQPRICTRLDWSDYGVVAPILGGEFTNTLLLGKNIVVDFGENVYQVDPKVNPAQK